MPVVELRFKEVEYNLPLHEIRNVLVYYYYTASEFIHFIQWQNTMGLYLYTCKDENDFRQREIEMNILHDRLYERLRMAILN